MRTLQRQMLTGVLLTLGMANAIAGQDIKCVNTPELCRQYYTVPSGQSFVTVYSNKDLSAKNSKVTRLVIGIHGSERVAPNVIANLTYIANKTGSLVTTAIVAPDFKISEDPLEPNEEYWSSSGWSQGDESELSGLPSFDVVDTMIETLVSANHFPNVKSIVIVGHSAGGQFTHRYSVGTRIDKKLTRFKFKFVVTNPSSYMYLNSYRAMEGESGFAIPNDQWCRFDDYRYGMVGRNQYMLRSNATTLTQNHLSRKVIYGAGTLDTETEDLDVGCEANYQGPNRYERAKTFFRYLKAFFPAHNHEFRAVPGVGHSSYGMYWSLRKDIFVKP